MCMIYNKHLFFFYVFVQGAVLTCLLSRHCFKSNHFVIGTDFDGVFFSPYLAASAIHKRCCPLYLSFFRPSGIIKQEVAVVMSSPHIVFMAAKHTQCHEEQQEVVQYASRTNLLNRLDTWMYIFAHYCIKSLHQLAIAPYRQKMFTSKPYELKKRVSSRHFEQDSQYKQGLTECFAF